MKPCPYCTATPGEKNLEGEQVVALESNNDTNYVRCLDCGYMGPIDTTQDGAIEGWSQTRPAYIYVAKLPFKQYSPLTPYMHGDCRNYAMHCPKHIKARNIHDWCIRAQPGDKKIFGKHIFIAL